MRKLLILFLIFSLSLITVSCSEKNINIDEIKEALITNSTNIKNYDVDATIDLSMKVNGDDKIGILCSTGSIFLDPYKAKLNTIINLDRENNTDIVFGMYSTVIDKSKVYYYEVNGTPSEGGYRLGDLSQFNVVETSKIYFESSENFKISEETFEGKDIYKINANVKSDSVKDVVRFTKALDQLLSMILQYSYVNSMYDKIETLPITFYVDKETLYPVKYEINFTEIVENSLSNKDNLLSYISPNGEIKEHIFESPTCTYTITFSNYNNATDFEVPKQ